MYVGYSYGQADSFSLVFILFIFDKVLNCGRFMCALTFVHRSQRAFREIPKVLQCKRKKNTKKNYMKTKINT